MNRLEVQHLQSIQGYPAISILLPTHRDAPHNRADQIRVKNLVKQATDRLLSEFPRRDIEPLLTRLDALVAQIDYRCALDGLALFVNQDVDRKFYLPFPVKEQVVIDETFATRDLVFALNHSPRYWVLVVSEKPTRLYEGLGDTLVEITENGFPMIHAGPGGAAPLPFGFGKRKSAYRDERHRQFFRQVDAAFRHIAVTDPLPLVVVGVDRSLAFFNEVSKHKKMIIATLPGNHDKTPAHEMAAQVWSLVQSYLDSQRKDALKALDAAVSTRKYASGIGEAWRTAKEGRAATLLVEEDFRYPARLDASGLHLRPADDSTAPDVIDDAVDELIEHVLAQSGQVTFVDNGALETHQSIALILRY